MISYIHVKYNLCCMQLHVDCNLSRWLCNFNCMCCLWLICSCKCYLQNLDFLFVIVDFAHLNCMAIFYHHHFMFYNWKRKTMTQFILRLESCIPWLQGSILGFYFSRGELGRQAIGYFERIENKNNKWMQGR
jgi:hypothetical protein